MKTLEEFLAPRAVDVDAILRVIVPAVLDMPVQIAVAEALEAHAAHLRANDALPKIGEAKYGATTVEWGVGIEAT